MTLTTVFYLSCALISGHLAMMLMDLFFQAEDGIRDLTVTGVQTCALPISVPTAARPRLRVRAHHRCDGDGRAGEAGLSVRARFDHRALGAEIGRASCRERV